MIVDGRSIPENELIETDVCIVGGGTAGITLAREFIGEKFKVCLLESGGLDGDRETNNLYKGANIGLPYYDLDKARARFLGGSSNRWHVDLGNNQMGLRLRPLDAIDFEQRDCVPYSGWPFDKAHLDPYYGRAQTICQVNPPSFDVADWSQPEKRPLLPFLNGDVKSIIYKAGPRRPFVKEYIQEVTSSDNITTILNANVLEIETNDTATKVTGLRAATLQGNAFSVSAKLFVLAAGGIETPRLLLLSNATQTTGLGNQNDLVGRFFMEHLHFWSGIFVPSNPNIFQNTALYNDFHSVNNVTIIGKLALSEEVLHREKLLNHNVQLMPRLISDGFLYPPIYGRGLRTKIKNASLMAKRKLRKALRRNVMVFRFANMTEQAPNPNSRVTLMPERDALGQNRAQLNWQITELDVRSAIRTQEMMGAALQKANLGKLYIQLKDTTPPRNLHGGYHHMGTTRMHVDSRKGVVDQNGKMHGISNLYIAGPSVFPTGGYANPVLTIVALTVRLADHIKTLVLEGGWE